MNEYVINAKKNPEYTANELMHHYTGTSQYYRGGFGLKLTDGSKDLFENFECWWFHDIIASLPQINRNNDLHEWNLIVNLEDATAVVEVFHSSAPKDAIPTYRQEISFTDFPCKGATVYTQGGVAFLPSEY